MTKTRWKDDPEGHRERIGGLPRVARTRRETVEEVLGLDDPRHGGPLLPFSKRQAILDHFGLELVPEQQYRMLKEGEIIKKGDEYWSHDKKWKPVVATVGGKVNRKSVNFARRPLPQYRTLEPGEIIREGDEYQQYSDGQWVPTQSAGAEASCCRYRRPLTEAQPCEWCGEVLHPDGSRLGEGSPLNPDMTTHECPPVELKAGDRVRGPSSVNAGKVHSNGMKRIVAYGNGDWGAIDGSMGTSHLRRHNPGDPPEGRRCR